MTIEQRINLATSKKLYVTPNLYLYLGKQKKTWYIKKGNTSKAIGTYPQMDETQALNISLNKSDIKVHTLQTLLEEYLLHKTNLVTPATIKRDRVLYRLLIKRCNFINKTIDKIYLLDIIEFYKELNNYEYIHRLNILLNLSYKYAIIHNYTSINPFNSIPISMLIKKPQVKHRASTTSKEFIQRLLKFINSRSIKLKVAYTLLLLLGLRVNTLVNLKIDMIDFDKKVIIIPAQIMKMKIEHIIPINDYIIKLLKGYISTVNLQEYLFPSNKSIDTHMNSESFRIILRKNGFSKNEITPHGFRSMISTICNDNEIDPLAIEWYLAHYNSSSVSRAYNHSQGLSRKRKVLDFWFGYLFKDLTKS